MPGERFVVAGDRPIVGAGKVDPLEDRVVGRVGDLPLGRLDVDRDAREQAVLAGVVGMEVAVDDRCHVVDRDARFGQGVRHASRLDAVVRIELVVAEPEPRVEQEDAAAMPDRIADHDPDLAGPRLICGEPELAKEERHDLGHHRSGADDVPRHDGQWWQVRITEAGRSTPRAPVSRRRSRAPERAHPKVRERGAQATTHASAVDRGVRRWRRGRDSNPRRVAPNRISSAAP